MPNYALAIGEDFCQTPGTGILPVSFSYQYNDTNQRYRVTLQDGSFWFYEYDSLGQLRSGKKYWPDGTPVPGQQFEYMHDDIGNRSSTKAGGDQNGANLRSASYTANGLNQYTSRGVRGAVDILGIAPASASVTVNSSAADYRRGEYFQELVTVANGANPVWQAINVTTSGGGSASGNVFVPRTPEDFDDPATPSVNEGYDLDGNQLRDGRWSYTWDGENRLVKLESLASAPTGSKRRLEFEYDWQGRRIKKKVTNLDTSSVLLVNKFLYDGWNLIAELNATNNAVIHSYMWGLDISGSMQGSGGVGGLLEVNDSANGVHFAAYDGNGNVAALVKGTDGIISAQYEYGPFAEPIRVTGPMRKINPIRFSTKYADDESDFLYYGYRYYNPSTGRWLNRDPIGEEGGRNLYAFVHGSPIHLVDRLGLQQVPLDEPVTSIDLLPPKCGECGVEALRLGIVGVTVFFGAPSDATMGAGFQFPMKRTVKLKRGGRYNPDCCLVFQQQKGKTIYNGVPQIKASNGVPLDGEWHLDPPYFWNGDTPGIAAGLSEGESWDYPGFHGFKSGDVVLDKSSFRLVAIDICHGKRVVKRSNTAKFRSSGTWPGLKYDYSN
jgi:RHS repeat-associated protein